MVFLLEAWFQEEKKICFFLTSGSFRVTPLELEEAWCDVIYLHIFYSLTH